MMMASSHAPRPLLFLVNSVFYSIYCYVILLCLSSKCVHAIGRNRVMWCTLNRNIALMRNCFPEVWEILPSTASGNISRTLGKQFPIVTSTPVTICIIFIVMLQVVTIICECVLRVRCRGDDVTGPHSAAGSHQSEFNGSRVAEGCIAWMGASMASFHCVA